MWKMEDKETERIIYEQWKKEWKKIRRTDDLFLKVFELSYEETLKKRRNNKLLNRISKDGFLIFLFLISLYLIYVFRCNIKELTFLEVLKENGWIFLDVVLFLIVFNKWMEIKKYNETWIRHSVHKQKLDAEMLKYLEEIKEYEIFSMLEREEKQKVFIYRVIQIWEDNHKIFKENMKREVNMMSVFDDIKEVFMQNKVER